MLSARAVVISLLMGASAAPNYLHITACNGVSGRFWFSRLRVLLVLVVTAACSKCTPHWRIFCPAVCCCAAAGRHTRLPACFCACVCGGAVRSSHALVRKACATCLSVIVWHAELISRNTALAQEVGNLQRMFLPVSTGFVRVVD